MPSAGRRRPEASASAHPGGATHGPRRPSPCPHLPGCPGCPRFDRGEPAPEATRRLRAWAARQGVAADVVSGDPRAFRHRARLSTRGRSNRPKIGIFARGTHRVVDIPRCEVHHPVVNRVAAALKSGLRETGASCYADAAHAGLLRGVQVAVERDSNTAQVVLICNADEADGARPLLDCVSRRLGDELHSLWWNGNSARTNRVLGDRWERIRGPEFTVERLGGARVFSPPGAFLQSNLNLFEQLVERAHGWVDTGDVVVELYAGCGSIGLGLLARADRVVFNEIVPDAIRGLRRGIDDLPASRRERASVRPGPAASATDAIEGASVVIVDPPRKGLDTEVVDALCATPPRRLIYASCGPDALMRESLLFQEAGLLLRRVVLYDLFPYTEHVEALACFDRAT